MAEPTNHSKQSKGAPIRYAELLGAAVSECPDWTYIETNAREAAGRFHADHRTTQCSRLYLVGSGDSLFAARSILPAFRRWTGLYIEDRTSIEFSRYEVQLLGAGDVVLAISNSGRSSRTRECILLAKERKIPTFGVTGSLDGPLASSVDFILHRPVRGFPNAPEDIRRGFLHAAEYLAAMYALYMFGLELGLIRGKINNQQKNRWSSQLRETISAVGTIAAGLEESVIAFVERHSTLENIWVIGAGPNRGTAEYSAAKFHEQVPINGVPQDLEEWAHLQYFLTLDWKKKSVVVVLAPEGNIFDRAMEVLTGIENAKGTSVLVTNSSNSFKGSDWVFPVSFPIDELLTPMIFHVPCQLMTFHWARIRGVRPTPLRRRDNFWLIREGVIRSSLVDSECSPTAFS